MSHHPQIPLVAVAADVKDIDGYRWHAVADQYLRALTEGAGVLPLILPSLDSIDFEALLERVDGVLFPGSRSNVHPTAYGEIESEAAKPYDPMRDKVTLPLIREALAKGVPLFAVCRGMQELNVAAGGSLVSEVQNLPGRADHRAPVSDDQTVRFAIRQDVDVKPGGLLARILGTGTHRVNSLHRQAVGRIGENLNIEALAPDGTIEAVSVKNAPAFALGVQWHPEYWVTSDAPSRALFAAFGDAVRKRMAIRLGMSSAAE
jgi:putative glutamine amidotransferase